MLTIKVHRIRVSRPYINHHTMSPLTARTIKISILGVLQDQKICPRRMVRYVFTKTPPQLLEEHSYLCKLSRLHYKTSNKILVTLVIKAIKIFRTKIMLINNRCNNNTISATSHTNSHIIILRAIV